LNAEELATRIREEAADRPRFVVAIAGPPGAGKSTLSEALVAALGRNAIVLPMDGFHLDNAVLKARGLLARKGAPETFDAAGFGVVLKRVHDGGEDVAIPLFDRSLDLARAGADVIGRRHRIVVVEGNYLLLDRPPWDGLASLLDFTVFLDVPREDLERRLVRRWLDHGLDPDAARDRASGNDMPNADLVIARSREADCVIGA
jgi:pantothenate kinase